jgi:hypothetical protein
MTVATHFIKRNMKKNMTTEFLTILTSIKRQKSCFIYVCSYQRCSIPTTVDTRGLDRKTACLLLVSGLNLMILILQVFI